MTDLNIERFIKSLGMLGSDHAGERAAAGLKAHQMLQDAGLIWADVISGKSLESEQPDAEAASASEPYPHRPIAASLLADWPDLWTDAEAGFLRNMAKRIRFPSEKQIQWLGDLQSQATEREREAA